jgi:hypothetical protein
MTAEQARDTALWEQIPSDYKTAIVTNAYLGMRYVKVDSKFMDNDIQLALQELGYYVYKNKNTNEYEIRW